MNEENLSFVEQLDLQEQQQRHRMQLEQAEAEKSVARAREDRKRRVGEKRWKTISNLGIGLLIVSVIFGAGLWLYSGTTGNHHKGPDPEIQREQNCFANGGGYVPKDYLVGDHGLCVFPGRKATQ